MNEQYIEQHIEEKMMKKRGLGYLMTFCMFFIFLMDHSL